LRYLPVAALAACTALVSKYRITFGYAPGRTIAVALDFEVVDVLT
jgi:hypothetical protein